MSINDSLQCYALPCCMSLGVPRTYSLAAHTSAEALHQMVQTLCLPCMYSIADPALQLHDGIRCYKRMIKQMVANRITSRQRYLLADDGQRSLCTF